MANKISVRAPGSASVVFTPHIQGDVSALSAPSLTVLIHGFNTTEEAASASFRTFVSNLRTESKRDSFYATFGSVWEFHWPGDNIAHPKLSVIGYSARVSSAVSSGEKLAEFLQKRLKTHQRVNIIAHSLGCRVALATLRALRISENISGPRPQYSFLFAAAVPETMCMLAPKCPVTGADCDGRGWACNDRGECCTGLGSLYSRPQWGIEEHIFFSPRDRVLKRLFRPGQAVFGEDGVAVGYRGGPAQARWDSTSDTQLDHGGYWPSRLIAKAVARAAGANPHNL